MADRRLVEPGIGKPWLYSYANPPLRSNRTGPLGIDAAGRQASAAGSAQVEPPSLHAGRERPPLLRRDNELRPLGILRVTHRHDIGQVARDLHTVSLRPRVAGLDP